MPSLPRPNANAPPAKQLSLKLAIRSVPEIVQTHGLVETHRWPGVSRNGAGECIRPVRRTTTAKAWTEWPELQLDSAHAQTALVLHCQRPPSDYLHVALGPDVRTPNWIASHDGGADVVYCLKRPVLQTENASKTPIHMLARINEYYVIAYGAERSFSIVLTHNPTHPHYAEETSWLRDQAWTLADLAEPIPRRWRIPGPPATAAGRNDALFRGALRFFGKPQNWAASRNPDLVQTWVDEAFEKWFPGLQDDWHPNETAWIAKSVSRICRKNLDTGQTQAGFWVIQSTRGKKSGQARRQTSIEAKQPWVDLGIHRATWYRHRGMPPPTLTDLRPWELDGVSRRTWERRRAVRRGRYRG